MLGEGVGPGVAAGDVEERHKGRVEGREVVRRHRPEEGRAHDRRCWCARAALSTTCRFLIGARANQGGKNRLSFAYDCI